MNPQKQKRVHVSGVVVKTSSLVLETSARIKSKKIAVCVLCSFIITLLEDTFNFYGNQN